jgi:hypothetical protein
MAGGRECPAAATRGTTNPNRLRRVDNWIVGHCQDLLRDAADPLVVDLGYGATPVTTVELRARLASAVRPDVRVVGLEIDPVRVSDAAWAADPPWLTFARGGFGLAGLRPVLVRAMNVLRQYEESDVEGAWRALTAALAPGGVLVEGTCDELGRLACWFCLTADGPPSAVPTNRQPSAVPTNRQPSAVPTNRQPSAVPTNRQPSAVPTYRQRSLTFAARLSTLDTPATLAQRLPKALIHRNVPGEPVHDLIQALDRAWRAAAGYAPFGPRQRWVRAVAAVRDAGWPVLDRPTRWRRGEMTVSWP